MSEYNQEIHNIRSSNNQKSEKSNKGTVILIVLLVLIIIGLGGYIIYDNFIKEEPVKEEIKKEEPKEDLNALAIILTEVIKNNDLNKLDADYFDKATTIDFTKPITNGELTIAVEKVCGGKYSQCINVDGKKVEKFIVENFNRKDVNLRDVICSVDGDPFYIYNAATEEYNYNEEHPGHGGVYYDDPVLTNVYSINKDKNKYELVLNKLYFNEMNDSENFTADLNGTVPVFKSKDYILQNSDGENVPVIEKIKTYYDANIDKFKEVNPKYKYTFVKTNDKYYLTKYEILK